MEDELIRLIEEMGFPIYRQGSFSDTKEYPKSFFTFWNEQSPDHAHYSNNAYGTEWYYTLNIYSSEPETTYKALADAREILKKNGWIVPSSGYDVYSDQPTHTGRGMEIIFLDTGNTK